MIDLIKQFYSGDRARYRDFILRQPDPSKKLLKDITIVIESITANDVKSQILDYMFSPLGAYRYEVALHLFMMSTILDPFHILVDDITSDLQSDKEESEREVDKIINAQIEKLGLQSLPPDIESKLTNMQRDILDLLEQTEASDRYIKASNSPTVNALKEVINISKYKLNNPGQVSMFDDGLMVDLWNDSETKSEQARAITVNTKSINGSSMVLHYAVEDFRNLLKHNEQASKLLTFYAEQRREEFSISEYSDLLGVRHDNAKKCLKEGAKVLTSIKQELPNNGGYIVIFPKVLIGESERPDGTKIGKKGKVIIRTDPDIDLSSGGQTTKLIPKYAYSLNKNAWFLADYIYSIFRNDAKNIDPDKGYHIKSISLMNIIPVLNLPHPDETERIKQFIIDPIQKAIDEFNQVDKAYHGGMRLSLDIDSDISSPSTRIKKGFLVAKLEKSEYFNLLAQVQRKRDVHISEAQEKAEKKEARIDAAKGRQLARLEAEKEKKSDS